MNTRKSKYEILKWLGKVVDSSTTLGHFKMTEKLLNRYVKFYLSNEGDDYLKDRVELSLKKKLDIKHTQLISDPIMDKVCYAMEGIMDEVIKEDIEQETHNTLFQSLPEVKEKSIQWWVNKITDRELAVKILYNCLEHKSKFTWETDEDPDNMEFNNLPHVISHCFDWSFTSEGYDFWARVWEECGDDSQKYL